MKVSRILRQGGLGSALVLFMGVMSYFVAGTLAKPQAETSTVTPFTFKAETYLYEHGSAAWLAAVSTVARRADGTTVHVASQDTEIAKNIAVRTIRNMDGSSVRLLDAAKVKSTLPPSSQADVEMRRKATFQPPPDCVYSGETLLKKEVGQVPGRVVEKVLAPSPADFRITAWAVPGLGCLVIQYRVERKNIDGTYELTSWKKPVSLVIGAPDGKLFNQGKAYTEMAPSEFGRRLAALLDEKLPPGKSPTMARADDDYNRVWSKNPGWTQH